MSASMMPQRGASGNFRMTHVSGATQRVVDQELLRITATSGRGLRFAAVAGRKRIGSAAGIRRAHPRAALSSEATCVGASKARARARRSTSARDCACVRTCDRSTQSRRLLSDANASAGFVYRTPSLRDRPAHRRRTHGRACGVPAAADLADRHHPTVAPAALGAGREHLLGLLQPQSRACPAPDDFGAGLALWLV